MGRPKVLLLGATGETGASILAGLLSANQFQKDVEVLVRPSSIQKQPVKDLAERGIGIRVADLLAPHDELVSVLSGVDVLISAIGPSGLLQQNALVKAAKAARIKRFVPCAFITIAPPKGAMLLRDEKEDVYNEIKKFEVPFTIIDVGYWYQISFPALPSGRVDYAAVRLDAPIHNGGDIPNIMTDLRDIGRFVTRIISDSRTLNKYVYTHGDVLSENEIFEIVEEMSGEKIQKTLISAEQIEAAKQHAVSGLSQSPEDVNKRSFVYITQYMHSKYVRKDNQPHYAKFLGYLDARELYPDFAPISFREFFSEVLEGNGKKPYAG